MITTTATIIIKNIINIIIQAYWDWFVGWLFILSLGA